MRGKEVFMKGKWIKRKELCTGRGACASLPGRQGPFGELKISSLPLLSDQREEFKECLGPVEDGLRYKC